MTRPKPSRAAIVPAVRLPELLPGSEYRVDDPELHRVANLPGLALAIATHVQVLKPTFAEKAQLRHLFREEASLAKHFFAEVADQAQGNRSGDRNSFVKDGTAWIDHVSVWTWDGISNPPDIDEYHKLCDRFDSLVCRFRVLMGVTLQYHKRQLKRLKRASAKIVLEIVAQHAKQLAATRTLPEAATSTTRWEPPLGFVGVKTIQNDHAYRKTRNGVTRNPPRSTIQRWAEQHRPSSARDPKTGEVYYPVDWVNARVKAWNPRLRNRNA